ncbi:hypothetical protein F3I62_15190 [Pseudomonas sp. R-28-1W-6]|jgi:Tfp pilus assembly protein PilX|uniref:PilX N-terminal domain-containing pilus assembly protein n=1 Tax=Pseudomonas sp. R-28-1W-6 TaxID=2650101 RepID=UPI001365F8F1|nr:PilX N-terminal domain-containing pilus assembly protein [Pseudomonas sp. R-28-1W-6]MWV13447.1 hypothetical protein [Pseudomonas sp. R-28-1W-6]
MKARQQGVALIIALIMLLLMTVMAVSAFNLSSTNVEAVGNQQWRGEALAAADIAIEQIIGAADLAKTDPAADEINVDINRDDTTDYVVAVDEPLCVQAKLSSSAPPSSLTLVGMSNSTWNTVWEIVATVQDADTGASVKVRSGVRVLLSDDRKNKICS